MGLSDKDLDNELAEFSTRIEKLRIRYQGYFLGLEKLPPLFDRDQMEKYIRQTPLNDARRAVHKFRFMALLQRFRTLSVQWDRILRDLEEGRITRESMRKEAGYSGPAAGERLGGEAPLPLAAQARGHGKRARKAAEAAAAAASGEGGPGGKAPATDAAAAGRPERPGGAPSPDDPLQSLYADYISARSSLGLPNDGITEPAFRASLERQRLVQSEKLGVPSVSFSVVVKEGRVILLARPVADAARP